MITRRSFGLVAPIAAISALSASAVWGAENLADVQRNASIALARSYYNSYNESNWLAVQNLFADEGRFFSNSGYFVLDSPMVDGMGSGHEETSGRLFGSDKIIEYLRRRRNATKSEFYISPDREQFWTPSPTTILAWMARPGGGHRVRGPSYEVHVFNCELELAGDAVVSAKIFSVHEMNLQHFELGNG